MEVLGEDHPDTAMSLNNLGSLLQAQGDYAGAKPYLERALAIRMEVLGEGHLDTAQSFWWMGSLINKREMAAANPDYERALAIFETRSGRNTPTRKA